MEKSDFEAMCIEGSKAFNSGWDELKQIEKKEGNLEYLCTVDEFATILEEEIRKLRKEEGQNN